MYSLSYFCKPLPTLLVVLGWLWVAQLSWSLLGLWAGCGVLWTSPAAAALPALLSRAPVPAAKGNTCVPWCALFSCHLAVAFSVPQKLLEPCLVHPFKALPSSHFGPADCLQALVYEQVFNAFFTGIHQRGFFPYGTNVALKLILLFFPVPF